MEERDLTPVQEILLANDDLPARLESEQIDVAYDAEFDIFMVTIGEAQPSATEELPDGLQLRFDPATLKISAFEILGFRHRYLKAHPEYLRNFEALYEPKPSYYTPQRPAREAARRLIPA